MKATDLEKEWDLEQNGVPFDSDSVSSSQKVWWKCQNCGYTWMATIEQRLAGNRCRMCMLKQNSHKNALPQEGESLGDLYPEIASEWDYDKNGSLTPYDVKPGSSKKVWWKCKTCGHEWNAVIFTRKKGAACPSCWEARRGKAQAVAPLDESLAVKYPEIASEWDYEKNIGLDPKSIYPKSGKKVWWKCKRNHEWKTAVSARTNGSGCPICNAERHTSFPEQALFWYLSRDVSGIVVNRHKEEIDGNVYEIDIYLPDLRTGIEYDGIYWHKKKQKQDKNKDVALKKHNIHLFRVKEGAANQIFQNIIEYNAKTNRDANLNWAIHTLETALSIQSNGTIDVLLHTSEILEQYKYNRVQNSLSVKYPEVASEWDYDKNGQTSPDMFAFSSNHKVWWKCSKCGHEWQASITNRTRGHGCPVCGLKAGAIANSRANAGESFGDKHPELLPEWDYENNAGIDPFEVNEKSHNKVWWKCSKCGYGWKASLAKRSDGRGCPFCGDRVVIVGKNDLFTLFPQLAEEWDYEKNIGLDPHVLSKKSHKRIYWKCIKCGNEWSAEVATRTSGAGCPKCSKRKAAEKLSMPPKGQSLADLYPDLILEWNSDKNNDLLPDQVFPQSQKKVWWKCAVCSHEWEAIIASRAKGRKCPLCSGHIIPNKNDFATKRPDLLTEWDYSKNVGLKPNTYGVQSHKLVWWKCSKCGHEWQATIQNRSLGYCKCPNCKTQN